MKTNYLIGILGLLAAIFTCECRADLNGGDDFNDNSEDTNRWGSDLIVSGAGVLTENNQRLEFTSGTRVTLNDIVVRPWILNSGSLTQNWEAQIDVSMPFLDFTNAQQKVFVGLVAFVGSESNSFGVEFGQAGIREFRSFFATNGVILPNIQAQTVAIMAAVRLSFDASSKVLSCFYDENGSDCGYSWTLLRAEEVGSKWGLNNTSEITIGVIGNSSATMLASTNNVFADTFRSSSGLTPALEIGSVGGSVVLAWSTNAAVCHLESTGELTPPICWHVSTNAPTVGNTNFTVTDTIRSTSTFYRLSR